MTPALARFRSDRHALQEAVSLALRLHVWIFRQGEVDQPPFAGRQRRKKLGTSRTLGLLGAAVRELLERLALMRAEPFGVEAWIDRSSQALGGDPTRQNLQAVQALALVGKEGLDVVADELKEHLGSFPAAKLD